MPSPAARRRTACAARGLGHRRLDRLILRGRPAPPRRLGDRVGERRYDGNDRLVRDQPGNDRGSRPRPTSAAGSADLRLGDLGERSSSASTTRSPRRATAAADGRHRAPRRPAPALGDLDRSASASAATGSLRRLIGRGSAAAGSSTASAATAIGRSLPQPASPRRRGAVLGDDLGLGSAGPRSAWRRLGSSLDRPRPARPATPRASAVGRGSLRRASSAARRPATW